MEVIFMPQHHIWKMLQCDLILIRIIHFHTGKMYYGDLLTLNVLISLTKKQSAQHRNTHLQCGIALSE